MKKRIFPLFVVLALLLSVSVSAADLTEQGSDQTEVSDLVFEEGSVVSTEILPVTDGEYSVAPLAEDYGVATTAVTYTLADIYDMLWAYDETSTARSVGGSLVALVGHSYNTYVRLGTTNNWLNSINQNITAGTSVLNSLLTQLQTVNGNLAATLFADAGSWFLNYDGSLIQLGAKEDLTYIVRSGFMGIQQRLNRYLAYNGSFLSYDGTITTSGADVSRVIRDGFIALHNKLAALNSSFHDLISGSETDNTYSGSITSNDNAASNFSAVGLGPMLNTWLAAIEKDLGQLAYMYADDDQLAQKAQEKEEAEQAKNEIAEKTEQMDSLVEDMNSVNKPDINSVVPDVSIVVSDNDISVISDSLAPWFQQSLFLNYFLAVCMLMFVSYVLFGKKR